MTFRNGVTLALLGLVVLGIAEGKTKKDQVSAVFQNARFVYVQSVDGDALNPNLYPEDRQAIFDVQEQMRDWNRYVITLRREDADLVFIVRKGRAAAARARVGVGSRTQPYPGQNPGQNPSQNPGQYPGQGPGIGNGQPGPAVGVGGEVGPSDDLLRVFASKPDGKLIGPVWSREMDGGLDAPTVEIVRQLKVEVERAYPQTQGGAQPQGSKSPAAPAQTPAQPQGQTQPPTEPQPQTPPQPQQQPQPQF
jgi:hypothetical protein